MRKKKRISYMILGIIIISISFYGILNTIYSENDNQITGSFINFGSGIGFSIIPWILIIIFVVYVIFFNIKLGH